MYDPTKCKPGDLDDLAQIVRRLDRLLKDRHPGLFAWQVFLGDEREKKLSHGHTPPSNYGGMPHIDTLLLFKDGLVTTGSCEMRVNPGCGKTHTFEPREKVEKDLFWLLVLVWVMAASLLDCLGGWLLWPEEGA